MTRRRFFGAIGAAMAAIVGVVAAREGFGDPRHVAMRSSVRVLRDGETVRFMREDGTVSEWTWEKYPDSLALAG